MIIANMKKSFSSSVLKLLGTVILPIFLLSMILLPLSVDAQTTCIVPSGYATIQSAVDDVACDLIDISAGTYFENVIVERPVTIKGQSSANTIVNGNSSGSVFSLPASIHVTLTQLKITNGGGYGCQSDTCGGGIYSEATLTISNTIISDNTATFGGAIYNDGDQLIIINTIITGNTAYQGAAIHNNGELLELINSDVSSNTASSGGGALLSRGRVVITGTTFTNNIAASAAAIYNAVEAVDVENSHILISQSYIANNTNTIPYIPRGGAIFNNGTLTITDSTVTSNLFTGNYGEGGGLYNSVNGTMIIISTTVSNHHNARRSGGGIYNDAGELQIISSVIRDNSVEGSGGGIAFVGVGGAMEVINSLVISNTASNEGGGISINGGDLIVISSTVDNNHAERGGGIHCSDSGGTIIRNSIFGNNTAVSEGGAISCYGGMFRTLFLTNTTVSGNSASSGGGIFTTGSAHLNHVTIANNTAGELGGGIRVGYSTTTIQGTLIANNTAPVGNNCDVRIFEDTEIVSNGYNLSSDNGCNLTSEGDLINSNSLLEPLGNNGGSTKTHAIPVESPAFNAASNGVCPLTDQRGVNRPQAHICDIGAFELEYEFPFHNYLPSVIDDN